MWEDNIKMDLLPLPGIEPRGSARIPSLYGLCYLGSLITYVVVHICLTVFIFSLLSLF
jgi:hypothetical protein